jgi:hypothetical protein
MAGEEELGTGIPTVFQGNIVAIFLQAVRIRWDDYYGILHTKTEYMSSM